MTAAAEDPGTLTTRVEVVDGTTTVVVTGEIDLTTAARVEEAVAEAGTSLRQPVDTAHGTDEPGADEPGADEPGADAAGSASLVVDMRGVTFCDSHGLSALLRSEAAATGHGVAVRLQVVGGSAVDRALERSGLSQVLSLDRTAAGS